MKQLSFMLAKEEIEKGIRVLITLILHNFFHNFNVMPEMVRVKRENK